MREKLIELIRMPIKIMPDAVVSPHITFTLPYAEDLADHLIANGVIVLPCKVGDTVYAFYSRREYKTRTGSRRRENTQIYTNFHFALAKKDNSVEIREKKCTKGDMNLLGRLVFATKEDAERVIADG